MTEAKLLAALATFRDAGRADEGLTREEIQEITGQGKDRVLQSLKKAIRAGKIRVTSKPVVYTDGRTIPKTSYVAVEP